MVQGYLSMMEKNKSVEKQSVEGEGESENLQDLNFFLYNENGQNKKRENLGSEIQQYEDKS